MSRLMESWIFNSPKLHIKNAYGGAAGVGKLLKRSFDYLR
ncbi:hypothetical protein IFVP177_C2150062 [Vibrio parahaemolyticus]